MAKKTDRSVKAVSLKEQQRALEEERKRIRELMYNDKISDRDKKFLIERVCQDVETDEAARSEYIATVHEIRDLYEGKKTAKTDPFENCSNVQTMIVAMVAELLHSRLFPIAYNENMTHWVPQESSDIVQAEGVSKFMPWALRRCKFEDFADDYVQSMIMEGTTIAKVVWDEEWRWVQRRIAKVENIKQKIQARIKNFMGADVNVQFDKYKDYEVKYEYKKFEHAKAVLLPIEDVGFPAWSVPGGDEDKLQHIWHRTRPFLDEIEIKAALGYYDNLSKLRDNMEHLMLKEGALQEAKADAEGTTFAIAKDIKMQSYPLELIEWYGKVKIPGEGRQECIVWVEAKTKTFLGIMPLLQLSRKNQRPFVVGQFIRRSNRMYGKTILDFVKELQKETDTIHNQRLDMGTMVLVPPIFYRAASGFEPEEVKVHPGVMTPVDDVNDVKPLQLPNNAMVSFQEERMLMELIEKITSVGSYQSGQESDINRSRATARGTMAIIAQGEQRFQTLGKRIQVPLGRVMKKLLEQYQQNIPSGMEERVLGEDNMKIFPNGLSAEDLVGNFDVIHSTDTTGGLKMVQKEQDLMLYQAMLMNPLVLNNPEGLWNLTAMVLEDAGKQNPEKYIGPKPEGMLAQHVSDMAQVIRRNISEIKQGREPKTNKGEDPNVVLAALQAYKDTPEGLALEPEKRALLDIRIEKIKLELVNLDAQEKSLSQMAEGMANARQGNVQGAIPGAAQGPTGAPSVEDTDIAKIEEAAGTEIPGLEEEGSLPGPRV